MSIVRVGLGENRKFAEGYEAIFGKPKAASSKKLPSSKKSGGTRKPRGRQPTKTRKK